MSAKKKSSFKKSLEYVRPQPGTFSLLKFPGVEFRFRPVSIDDEAWCIETFGKPPGEMVSAKEVYAAELCRMYFHFLTDEGKERFIPEEKEEINYDTGKREKVVVPGYKLFMRSIDGGSMTEMLLVARAFLKTLIGSRPIADLPDDLKKNVMEWLGEREKKLQEPQPPPPTPPAIEEKVQPPPAKSP